MVLDNYGDVTQTVTEGFDQMQKKLDANRKLGGTLGDFKISLVVLIEVPIRKYFSGPQHYNPGKLSSSS